MVVPEGVDYEAFDGSWQTLIFMIAAPAAEEMMYICRRYPDCHLTYESGFKESLIRGKGCRRVFRYHRQGRK